MSEDKTSILLADISVEGNLVEKDKIILDAKISGDVKAGEVITHSRSNITGNVKSKLLMIMIINCNENDYQYHYVAYNTTKKCVGALWIYVYAEL